MCGFSTPKNSLAIWTPSGGAIIQFHPDINYQDLDLTGLGLSLTRLLPTSHVSHQVLGAQTLPSNMAIGWVFSKHPSCSFLNSLEWLSELQKTLYLLLLVYYKWTEPRSSPVEKMSRSRCALEVCHPPGTSRGSPTWKLFESDPLGGFMEISLHGYGWLNHSLLVIELPSCSPFPSRLERSDPAAMFWPFWRPALLWNYQGPPRYQSSH